MKARQMSSTLKKNQLLSLFLCCSKLIKEHQATLLVGWRGNRLRHVLSRFIRYPRKSACDASPVRLLAFKEDLETHVI